jgi:hypothetical protein
MAGDRRRDGVGNLKPQDRVPTLIPLMEISMNNQTDRDAIAEEAVGQRRDGAPPYAVKEEMSPEEAVRRIAESAGAAASTPEKTAESVGERVGDAYSDPESSTQTQTRKFGLYGAATAAFQGSASDPVLATRRTVAQFISDRFNEQPFAVAVACFALGYATAVLLHGRTNANVGTTPGPFQITRPPRGERHPRGFVQSTVLKTITEHPQGMTIAEIVKELAPQDIGQRSIADALGVLVQEEKVSLHGGRGKYIPAAAEVPTAPDQPSS